MTKENLKQALISLLIAAISAFLATLASGLADLLKTHAVEATSGILSAAIYLAKAYKG